MSQDDSTGGQEERKIALQVNTYLCRYCKKKKKIYLRFQLLTFYGCPFLTEQQKSDAQHFPSRQFIQRRPGPPTMVPSKNHVSSPLTNQLASMNALFNSTQSQAILQGHSHNTPSTTASSSGNSNSATRSSMNEMSGHANIGPGNTNQMA